ncbi:MAG TPA: IPT/TIG domain-containing protein [Thermoanaerobaculia bacterium]|nr:IPT/TIG domain-containing protein [Thermoanaerobaculia bacterium]
MTQQKSLKALLLAVVFVFAACKGESPTAPPPGGGTGGGNNPPTTGIAITLTASNANPVVDSPVVITAAVTVNGAAAPNGTAVEFVATGGSFSATEVVTALLRTTTNGSASVELRSTVAGVIRVQATVGNVSRTVDVTFKVSPTIPPPTSQAPSITSVSPAIGIPSGGQRITIIGRNFKEPVKVLFDTGGPLPVETLVISRTDTQLEVFTPSVNLGVGQQLVSDIIVITQAGTVNEARAELEDGFTFRLEVLTPRISTTTPNSGPVTGGTRVTIFGDGFQSPVQVLFGSAEARVVSVDFSQIVVESPSGRDTSPGGSGAVTGPVTITVRNINSQTSATMVEGFRYVAAVEVISVGPTEGPFTGGTRVTIDGIGFVAPVAVSLAGFPAQPISVTGTRLVVLASGITLTGCDDITGPTTVTNIVNGDQADGPDFVYRVPRPLVTGVNPSTLIEGSTGSVTVTVLNAQAGPVRITIGTRAVFPTGVVFNPDGTAVYTVPLPTNFDFPTEDCSIGGVDGSANEPLDLDVTYLNLQTTCTDTAAEALTIIPLDQTCQIPASPESSFVVAPTNGAGCAVPPTVTVGNTSDAIVTFTNSGGAPLTVDASTITGPNADEFTILPSTRVIAPGASASFTITFTPTAAGAKNASVSFATNDPDEGAVILCIQATANP